MNNFAREPESHIGEPEGEPLGGIINPNAGQQIWNLRRLWRWRIRCWVRGRGLVGRKGVGQLAPGQTGGFEDCGCPAGRLGAPVAAEAMTPGHFLIKQLDATAVAAAPAPGTPAPTGSPTDVVKELKPVKVTAVYDGEGNFATMNGEGIPADNRISSDLTKDRVVYLGVQLERGGEPGHQPGYQGYGLARPAGQYDREAAADDVGRC